VPLPDGTLDRVGVGRRNDAAEAEAGGQHVAHCDRAPRGDRVVELRVDALQHPAVRQLRQPALDRVVEPQLPPAVVVPTASTRTSSPRATSVTIPGMSPRATKPAIAASRLSLLIVAP
jgi:hypothetical protein